MKTIKNGTEIAGKMQNVRIYDNGGKSVDRFTVVYLDEPERSRPGEGPMYSARAMDEEPYAPQGFGQYTTAMDGLHLGVRIKFEDLSADCQKVVLSDLADGS